MKNKILIIVIFLLTYFGFSQTNTVDINDGIYISEAPAGTYVKDMYGTFTKYLGTWKYQNGNAILIFKLEKVARHYYSKYNAYEDFIKGNYSYSTDGGNTYIVNTIVQNVGNNDPNTNPMYTYREEDDQLSIIFGFQDVVYNKKADAKFTFTNPSNLNEIHFKLIEREGQGYLYPTPLPPAGFSIPDDLTLIKVN